jgi:hypothetical protein
MQCNQERELVLKVAAAAVPKVQADKKDQKQESCNGE